MYNSVQMNNLLINKLINAFKFAKIIYIMKIMNYYAYKNVIILFLKKIYANNNVINLFPKIMNVKKVVIIFMK